MPDRVENESFYSTGPTAKPGVVEEDRFYGRAERPPPQPSALVALAQNPVKFGGILFVVGWMGILVQQGFFSQIVAGAPLFEEPAKVGGAIALAGLLSFRLLLVRLPLAAAMGAGFGVFEHYLTYAEEDAAGYGIRVAFHALSTATSMAAFTALETDPDVRLRWASTIPSTVLHYANNFIALVLGLLSLALPVANDVATFWAMGVTALLSLTLLVIAGRPERFRARVGELMRRLIPAMRPNSQANSEQR